METTGLPEEITGLLHEFHIALEALHRSPKTITSYFQIYDHYFNFLKSTNALLPIAELGRRELNSYLVHLRNCQRWPNRPPSQENRGLLSPFTIQDHARTIKALWGWLFRDGYIDKNPLEKFPLPSVPKTIVRIITKDQFKRLTSYIDTSTPTGERYYCIITILYGSGPRISEIVTAFTKDVNFDLGFIRVTGKGNKERDIPLSKTALREIRRYLRESRPKICSIDSPYLFPDSNGKPLSVNSVEQFITRLKIKAGFENVRIYPHLFRHSFGTEFINAGGSVFALKEILGHSSLTTTLRYTHLQPADLRREHSKFSPIEHLNKHPQTKKSRQKHQLSKQTNINTYNYNKKSRIGV